MKLSIHEYISIYIHQTDLLLTSYVKEKLAPYNIAPEQNLIMMLLWEKDGLTQNEVARKLDKDKTNIARMSHSLEQKGFIRRVNCPSDRRSQRLYLTDEGLQLGETIIPIAEEFNRIVNKGISDEELQELKRTLAKMRKNVE